MINDGCGLLYLISLTYQEDEWVLSLRLRPTCLPACNKSTVCSRTSIKLEVLQELYQGNDVFERAMASLSATNSCRFCLTTSLSIPVLSRAPFSLFLPLCPWWWSKSAASKIVMLPLVWVGRWTHGCPDTCSVKPLFAWMPLDLNFCGHVLQ